MPFSPCSRIFIFAPFFAPIVIAILAISSSLMGFNSGDNRIALSALLINALGLLVGVISLFLVKSLQIWWRLLLGLLYVPSTVFSLLISGF